MTFLGDYQYEFELVKSQENTVADILSRDYYINRNTVIKNVNNSQTLYENINDVNNSVNIYENEK